MQVLPMSMDLHPRQLSQTAEMVTSGHPDKFCDQVADAILDATLEQEATGRPHGSYLGSLSTSYPLLGATSLRGG